MRIASQVVLTSEQRAKLEAYVRGRRTPARAGFATRPDRVAGRRRQAGPENCPPAFDRAAHCCSLALAFSARRYRGAGARRSAVGALQKRILAYIEEHNRQPKPFIWTAKANDILEKVKRAKTNLNDSSSGPVTWKETPLL